MTYTVVYGRGGAGNTTWHRALAAQPAPPPPPPPPPKPARRWNDAAHGAALAAQCLAWPEVLTEWERGFCRSVAARGPYRIERAPLRVARAAVADWASGWSRDKAVDLRGNAGWNELGA